MQLSEYIKNGGEIHSSENQRIIGELVNREVVMCASCLVSDIMRASCELNRESPWGYDELINLSFAEPDFEEEGRQQGWQEVSDLDEGEAADVYQEANSTSDEAVEEMGEDGEDFRKLLSAQYITFVHMDSLELSYAESWKDLADEQGFYYEAEDNRQEVLEHWIVTSWAARKLAELGECTGEVSGLEIWGRTCSGQSIALDCVWAELACSLEILVGQESSWEGK